MSSQARGLGPEGGGGDRAGLAVRIALLADAGLPAQLATELADELPGLLSERVDSGVSWEVTSLEAGVDSESEADLIEAARERMRREGWHITIGLSDLPLRAQGRPVVVDAKVADGIGTVSVAALGPVQPQLRAREAVIGLVGHLHGSAGRARPSARAGDLVPPAPSESPAPASENVAGRPRLLSSGTRANLRLLGGMVRANRPWRLFLGLPRALTAAIAAAAIAMMNATTWQVGDTLGAGRLWLLTFGSLVATVVWLVVVHGLWERTRGHASAEQTRRFNAVTALTLGLGALCMYVVLFAINLVAAELLIEADLLRAKLEHPVGLGDYLTLAWVVTSTAIIGGALGAGLESGHAVRNAAYGGRNGRGHPAAADPSARHAP